MTAPRENITDRVTYRWRMNHPREIGRGSTECRESSVGRKERVGWGESNPEKRSAEQAEMGN